VLALLTSFFYLAGVLAVWVYVGAMSHQAGNSSAITSLAFSLAFAFQVAGGTTASVLAKRVPALGAIVICGGLSVALTTLISIGASGVAFIACVMLFAGFWTFVTSYLLPFTVDSDPSLKAAPLIASAQLFGCAAGPAIASLATSETDVRAALWTGAALFVSAVVIALLTRLIVTRARRRYVSPGLSQR
jgi:predicted MFS family arabinose efflux permease